MQNKRLFACFPLAFLCVLLSLSLVLFSLEALLAPAQAVNATAQAPVFILDAGHGGEDGGATGVNGVLEKDLNLSLTRILADLLRGAGFAVIESRTEDKLLYDEGTPKGHKKQGDLSNRLRLAESAPQNVLISIHMNTFPAPECHGLQVWYSPNNEGSRQLAEAIQGCVKKSLQPQNNRRVKAATSGIYLLRHCKTPAVLIECGFLSNAAECAQLCDPCYQRELALALFQSIAENFADSSC